LPFRLISRCIRSPIHDRAVGTVGRFRQQLLIAIGKLCHIAPSIVNHPKRQSARGDHHRAEEKCRSLDPVRPLNFGFKWGVDPVFDLTSIGPPVEFKAGGDVKARYVLKLIDKPGSLVPRLGLFVQGDFRGTIDWTSKSAESRPEIDFKGSFLGGFEGRF
jgi:hypothetical protein